MSFSKRDQKHIWHPLVQHKNNPEMLAIKKPELQKIYTGIEKPLESF
jgi:adenosylmethionine-8-amino-7-oxononanoate aminotransferase